MAELEALALRSALAARTHLPRNTFLTVNVSPDVLASGPVREIWRDVGDLGGVVVELTEQTPIESYDALEVVPTATSIEHAAGLFTTPDIHTVVIVDERRRPLWLYTPDLLPLDMTVHLMRVNLDTPVQDALRRAMTREQRHRFTPVLCIGNAGRFIGIVRIERLTHALASR